ncbi:MAG: DUF1572 family protein [Bacteroidia bacterium]|nr:DUF1572 family protein [Bacteroidia bacterium]
MNFTSNFVRIFSTYRTMAEKAMAQLSEEECFFAPGEESNSVAVIVKHMSGNLRSRFTDFYTSDGEKPDRNRDSEFVTEQDTVQSLKESWDRNWAILEELLQQMQDSDLERTVYIRGEAHTVFDALQRQVAHYAYHTGQIVYLAKMIRNTGWKTLSIPRNGSEAFFREMMAKHKPAK